MERRNIGSLRRQFSFRDISVILEHFHDDIVKRMIPAQFELDTCDYLLRRINLRVTPNDTLIINYYDNNNNNLAHVSFHMNIFDNANAILDETPVTNHIVLSYRIDDNNNIYPMGTDIRFNLRLFYNEYGILSAEPGNQSGVYLNIGNAHRDQRITIAEFNYLMCIIYTINLLLRELYFFVYPQQRGFQQQPYNVLRVGGSNINYYEKYLKYKKKYIELKNKIN